MRAGETSGFSSPSHITISHRHPAALFSRRGAEVDLGRGADALFVLDGELRLFLIAEHHRGEVARKLPHHYVVPLHRLDVTVACDGDPVLRVLELRLQIAKIGVRLELGITLDDDQQSRKRGGELPLRRLKLCERAGIVDELGCGLDRADPRARW